MQLLSATNLRLSHFMQTILSVNVYVVLDCNPPMMHADGRDV